MVLKHSGEREVFNAACTISYLGMYECDWESGTNEKHTVKYCSCQEFVSHVGKNVLIMVSFQFYRMSPKGHVLIMVNRDRVCKRVYLFILFSVQKERHAKVS